jgi:hypothetical protein
LPLTGGGKRRRSIHVQRSCRGRDYPRPDFGKPIIPARILVNRNDYYRHEIDASRFNFLDADAIYFMKIMINIHRFAEKLLAVQNNFLLLNSLHLREMSI